MPPLEPGKRYAAEAETNTVPLAKRATGSILSASRSPGLTQWRRARAAALAGLYGLSLSMAAVLPASAQRLPLIRDTEVEDLLREYSRPIFRAAGLETQNINMRIVNSDAFNAFVAPHLTDPRLTVLNGAQVQRVVCDSQRNAFQVVSVSAVLITGEPLARDRLVLGADGDPAMNASRRAKLEFEVFESSQDHRL